MKSIIIWRLKGKIFILSGILAQYFYSGLMLTWSFVTLCSQYMA